MDITITTYEIMCYGGYPVTKFIEQIIELHITTCLEEQICFTYYCANLAFFKQAMYMYKAAATTRITKQDTCAYRDCTPS